MAEKALVKAARAAVDPMHLEIVSHRRTEVADVARRYAANLGSALGFQIFSSILGATGEWLFVTASIGIAGAVYGAGPGWQRARIAMARAPRAGELPEGVALRLRGRIEAPGGDENPHVLVATRYQPVGRGHRAEEVRGRRILLRLGDGRAVALDTAHVDLMNGWRRVRLLADQHQRVLGRDIASDRGLKQAVLRVGDEVELVACVTTHVDPTAPAAPGRGTPLVATLVPGRSGRIPLRRCR